MNSSLKISSSTSSEPVKKTNPLEVGPHISVTMVNKANEQKEESGKFSISLKKPSELMDPSKGGTGTRGPEMQVYLHQPISKMMTFFYNIYSAQSARNMIERALIMEIGFVVGDSYC